MLHPVQVPGSEVTAYHAPSTLEQALGILAADVNSRPIAGGTDLMIEMDRGVAAPQLSLVDITRIPGLSQIEVSPQEIRIGALVTHNDVVSNAEVVANALPLAQACLEVGSPALRNRATIVGNVVTASPANDTLSALVALDATVHIASLGSTRSVPIGDFTTGVRSTVLAPAELVTAITIPVDGKRRGIYAKLGLRKAQAISVVHLGVSVWLNAIGEVSDCRIALGSVGPTIVRASTAEAALIGQPLTHDAIAETAIAAAAEISPIDDLRAPGDYRRNTTEVLVRRCLVALMQRTESQAWPPTIPTLRIANLAAVETAKVSLSDTDTITAVINGDEVTAGDAVNSTLLDWLRHSAHESAAPQSLRGVQEGCAEGECGACTVIMNGKAVLSCLIPAARAHGESIITVEGLANGNQLAPVQQAFIDHTAVQCGFCIPGFLVSSSALAEEFKVPTEQDIDLALSGNLCRCTGYYKIRDAVASATRVEIAK